MSSTQRVVWTACPNGLAKNGKLRISVAIGPQLTLPAGATTGTLSQFPDWGDWAAARIGWQVKVGGTTVPATVVSAKPSSTLYTAMFHPLTPVNGHAYKSPTGSDLYTNSVATMRDHFSQLYTRLAGEVSPDGRFPTWDTLEGRFSAFPPDDDRLNALIGNLKQYFNPTGAPGGPINRKVRDTPSLAVPLNYKFLQPRVTAKATPRPPVLKPDFHQGYSLLQRHPALLRLFGFVVDLEVTLPSGLTGTVGVSVIPAWTPRLGAANTTSVTPVTMTDTATWLATPRPASSPYPSAITGGLLPLDDPTQYAVVEMDTDGATLKSVNFVKSAFNAQSLRRSADTPNSYALTSLRSAGLSVAALGHAELVYGNWQSGDSINGQLTGSAATLYAEDIAQGYRIDVHDSRRGHWFQLCARSGDPKHLNGYGIGHPQHVVPVPAGDEGWVEPVTTQSPETPSGTPEVYLPETLFRWNGWSLVANRPGKHLSEDGSDSLQSDSGNPPPSGAAFQVQIDYAATPGTLPALRFTRGYRFRARVVDLAGNSLPFDKNAPFTHASPEFSYGRLEPLASPVIVPTAPRTAGESLETIVIRSNYNIPDAVVTPAQRHLAPPSVSIEMAEALGQFDDASGRTRTDLYGTLAARDGLSFSSPSVLKEFGGTVEDVDGQEWIWYPPGHGFAVPYLPDPLGAGTALAGLPGAGGNRVIVPFTGGWPARRSIRLVVKAGSGAPVPPPPGAQDGALTVHAPKASVTTALLSSWFEPGSLHFFQLWSWMTAAGGVLPAVQKLIEAGGHYMFTPYRALTIVHAVRQPLTAPVVNKITAGRNPGDTFALLSGEVHANPASSQRVDVLSSYTDPYDDGSSAAGIVQLQHNARVFEIQPDPRDPAGIGFTAMRHDFGDTKHHFVYYSLLATSRFLEYFADTATVALHHVTPVEVSKAGFVAGTVVVTGTGANAKTHYSPGRDYTENDTVGTIARIAAGAIGDGAKVSVTYVAPPVTRSSLEKDAHPPTPKGFLVQIPSSQRPPTPDVRSVLPVFGWHKSSTSSTVTSTRAGSMLRVYLGRPWWASGAGEHLGVIVANPVLPGTALPPDIAPLVSGYGTDPLFATGARTANPLTLADFTLATATRQNVLLAEQAETTAWVSVAGHSVSWDPARKLWYADIALNISPSYFPFVQLALVRYQPSSLTGIEVSRVVVADMIQVAPDRTLQLTYPSSTVVSVTVSGPGFFDSDGTAPSTMTVYVQEATVKTSDPDLTWATVPGQLAGAVLKVTSETDAAFTWQGDVKLPAPRGSRKLRLLVSESENYPSVRTGTLTGRVSYLDAVEI